MKEVLILEGGFNEEHKISLTTSKEIKKILNKYKINYQSLLVNPNTFNKDIDNFSKKLICFNALHGPFGEDGKIQKILRKKKFKFTHSGINSSKVCFNKVKSKNKVRKINIPTPFSLEIKSNLININHLHIFKKKYNQFVIKPNESGSSFGIKIIKNDNDFKEIINNLNKYKKELKDHKSLIVEKYIEGKELTVAVMQIDNKLQALGVTEILSKNKFFDYKAKYSKGFSKHILPAKISKQIYNKCLKYALKAHKILNCNAISRSDFIYDQKNHTIYYLETNTQPGLTSISLLPEQAQFNNISFDEIVLHILRKVNE